MSEFGGTQRKTEQLCGEIHAGAKSLLDEAGVTLGNLNVPGPVKQAEVEELAQLYASAGELRDKAAELVGVLAEAVALAQALAKPETGETA
jgi:hypothetical protein